MSSSSSGDRAKFITRTRHALFIPKPAFLQLLLRRNKVPVSLYEVGRRLFGTWTAAVEAAGLRYEEVTGVRRWSRDKVIKRIQELASQGVPLHATYVAEHYPFLHRAAIKLFPHSWGGALRAAGFDPEQHKMPR